MTAGPTLRIFAADTPEATALLRRVPLEEMTTDPGVSARTAATQASASAKVRTSANSTAWKPEPIARIA